MTVTICTLTRVGLPDVLSGVTVPSQLVRILCMSIVLGESLRDVRACPYFRGRTVCSRADIGIGSILTSQASGLARCCHQQPSGGREHDPTPIASAWVSPDAGLRNRWVTNRTGGPIDLRVAARLRLI